MTCESAVDERGEKMPPAFLIYLCLLGLLPLALEGTDIPNRHVKETPDFIKVLRTMKGPLGRQLRMKFHSIFTKQRAVKEYFGKTKKYSSTSSFPEWQSLIAFTVSSTYRDWLEVFLFC